MLDTDILISPKAKNVFDFYDSYTYGLISKIKNLPILEGTTLKKCLFYETDFMIDVLYEEFLEALSHNKNVYIIREKIGVMKLKKIA